MTTTALRTDMRSPRVVGWLHRNGIVRSRSTSYTSESQHAKALVECVGTRGIALFAARWLVRRRKHTQLDTVQVHEAGKVGPARWHVLIAYKHTMWQGR